MSKRKFEHGMYCSRSGCYTRIDGSSLGRVRQCARCLRLYGVMR